MTKLPFLDVFDRLGTFLEISYSALNAFSVDYTKFRYTRIWLFSPDLLKQILVCIAIHFSLT